MSVLLLSNQNLSELKKIDKKYKKIFIDNNNLTELPELHNEITHIYCYKNKLTKLPKLPKSLQVLDCSYNLLKEIPKIPKKCQLIANDNKFRTVDEDRINKRMFSDIIDEIQDNEEMEGFQINEIDLDDI